MEKLTKSQGGFVCTIADILPKSPKPNIVRLYGVRRCDVSKSHKVASQTTFYGRVGQPSESKVLRYL
jgi:hypothetical protein